MWLAYPNFDLWPLVFVANTPLMFAARGQAPRRRFLLGWIAGTVLTLGSHHFIAGTLVNLGGLPWAVALPVFFLYSAWSGIQLGLFTLGYGWLRTHGGRWLWLLTVPLWFALCERLFPVWFQAYISNVLAPAPRLIQSLELIGPSGLTALVMLAQCALVDALERPHPARWRTPALALTVWVVIAVWGQTRIAAVRAAPIRHTTTVTLLQPNMTIAEKISPNWAVRERVWDRTVAMTRAAAQSHPDLLIWPEGAFPFTYERDAWRTPRHDPELLSVRYSRRLHRLAKSLNLPFVAAGLRRQDGKLRNGSFFFTPGDPESLCYDKRKLVLLAERVPLADTFPSLPKKLPGASHYVPGETFRHFVAHGVRFVPTMCYDAVFPAFMRAALAFKGGGDVLLNLTNDVWFGATSEGYVHLLMQLPRAVENRTWLVRATNSGVSAIIDPTGKIVAQTAQDTQTTLTHTLQIPELPPTFYHRYGDLIVLLLGALAALATAFRVYQSRRSSLEPTRPLEPTGSQEPTV